ncbi:hypothetical protein [Bacillus infantis]|uniref:hypothetical protein n=1 Tax=Bacillus infantis TaxID=324767 RepID=UPI003CE9E047
MAGLFNMIFSSLKESFVKGKGVRTTIEYTGTGATKGGKCSFVLTDDETPEGKALFSTIHSVLPSAESKGDIIMTSYSIDSTTNTVTVKADKLTASLLNLIPATKAPDGTKVSVTIKGE